MARIKPDPHVVENRAQCEGALAEMAAPVSYTHLTLPTTSRV